MFSKNAICGYFHGITFFFIHKKGSQKEINVNRFPKQQLCVTTMTTTKESERARKRMCFGFCGFVTSLLRVLLIRMRANATRQHQRKKADTINSLISCVLNVLL